MLFHRAHAGLRLSPQAREGAVPAALRAGKSCDARRHRGGVVQRLAALLLYAYRCGARGCAAGGGWRGGSAQARREFGRGFVRIRQSPEVTEAQVRRLYEQSLDQAKTALEPYGYYEAKVQGQLEPAGQHWRVTLQVVTPGEPVKVTGGARDQARPHGREDRRHPSRPARDRESQGARTLNHGQYDSNLRRAQWRAYRQRLSRYATGHPSGGRQSRRTQRGQASPRMAGRPALQIRRGAFRRVRSSTAKRFPAKRCVPSRRAESGFRAGQVAALQQALNGADYFSVVNVLPGHRRQKERREVDVKVELSPAKRTIYSGSPVHRHRYPASACARRHGAPLGESQRPQVEERADRGAEASATLSTLYTDAAAGGPNQRSFNYGATYRDSNTDTSKSKSATLNWSPTKHANGMAGCALSASMRWTARSPWVRKAGESDNVPGLEHGQKAICFYLEATLSRKSGDNPIFSAQRLVAGVHGAPPRWARCCPTRASAR